MSTSRGLRPITHGEWVACQARVTDKAAAMLAGLVEELGADTALGLRSPELQLVRNLVGLVVEAGGSVATDALRLRLRRRLAEDLDRDELSAAMGDLGFRIAEALSRPANFTIPRTLPDKR